MALILSDTSLVEAERILAAKNAFEVLEILPMDVTPELVQHQYEKKVRLFKRLFRNKTAASAKTKLDEAKARLLDRTLLEKEVQRFNAAEVAVQNAKEEMRELELRTRALEARAAAVLEARAMQKRNREQDEQQTEESAAESRGVNKILSTREGEGGGVE